MRHRMKGRKLGRTASHKKALLRNLANQLFEHKEIKTTTAKAKETRTVVERMITYAKKGDLHHRRLAFKFLRRKSSIDILFDEIAEAYSDRQGGYTRVLKLGRRQGDGALLSLLQLVGFEKLEGISKSEKKKRAKKKAEKKLDAVETVEENETTKEESEEVKDSETKDIADEPIDTDSDKKEEK